MCLNEKLWRRTPWSVFDCLCCRQVWGLRVYWSCRSAAESSLKCFCVFRITCSRQDAEHHQLPLADLRPAGSGSDGQCLPRPPQGTNPHQTHLSCSGQVTRSRAVFLGENLKQTLVILPRKCFCWSSLTVNSVQRGWIRTDPTSFWRVNSDSLHKESQLSIRCLLLKESVSSDQSEQSINRYQDCFCPVKRPQRKHLWFLSWASTSITDDWKHWFCWLMGAKRSVLRTLFLLFTSVNWDFISKIFSSDLTSHFVYSRSKKSLQASNCTDRGFPQTFDVNL